ncbi:hypothetical protein [Levilactobacillus namurensis]|uniref:hypothetical protein n=1 Tax=Levilactobacillus namurensis TaxID=380393 RepID=UPI0004632593|nr:hypothetical protein [Levilactobacillus namurensis]
MVQKNRRIQLASGYAILTAQQCTVYAHGQVVAPALTLRQQRTFLRELRQLRAALQAVYRLAHVQVQVTSQPHRPLVARLRFE